MKQQSIGWKSDEQSASLDRFADRYVVYPTSTGEKGWGVPCRPFKVLPLDATPVQLAQAVLDGLSVSRNQWPPAQGVQEDGDGVLRAANIKSWKQYDPVALVEIDRYGNGRIGRVPMMREGAGHGPVSSRDILVPPGSSVEVLAQKLEQAISKSAAAYRPRRRRR